MFTLTSAFDWATKHQVPLGDWQHHPTALELKENGSIHMLHSPHPPDRFPCASAVRLDLESDTVVTSLRELYASAPTVVYATDVCGLCAAYDTSLNAVHEGADNLDELVLSCRGGLEIFEHTQEEVCDYANRGAEPDAWLWWSLRDTRRRLSPDYFTPGSDPFRATAHTLREGPEKDWLSATLDRASAQLDALTDQMLTMLYEPVPALGTATELVIVPLNEEPPGVLGVYVATRPPVGWYGEDPASSQPVHRIPTGLEPPARYARYLGPEVPGVYLPAALSLTQAIAAVAAPGAPLADSYTAALTALTVPS